MTDPASDHTERADRLDQTLPAEGAKTAHFCSMKVTQEVRDFAAKQNSPPKPSSPPKVPKPEWLK